MRHARNRQRPHAILLLAALLCAASASAEESRFTRAIRTAQPSVVRVAAATRSLLGGRSTPAVASGVILTPDGYIVTCLSTLGTSKTPDVTLPDGTTAAASIVRRDTASDLALLKIDKTGLKPIVLSDSPLPTVGQWVLTIGNPFALARTKSDDLSASVGVVSALKSVRASRLSRPRMMIITDIIINPGASGGAMVDLDGKLIGVCGPLLTSARSNTQLSFAVPVAAVKKLLDDARAAAAPPPQPGTTTTPEVESDRGYLGAYILDDNDVTRGAYIQRVVPGSPADEAGLRQGDLVTRINDVPTPNGRLLIRTLDTLKIGDTVHLAVLRDKTPVALTVKLTRTPRSVLK